MYSKQLSSAEPGLIIIMVDQSGSMSDKYDGNQNKAEFAALSINRVIENIIAKCSSGETIKDRVYVAVIGYGSKVEILFLETVSELAKNTKVTNVKKKVPDGAGGLIEVEEPMRIWLNPLASGGTPMAKAFAEAKKGVEKFLSKNKDSFPPIIINITDGEPNEFYQKGNFDETTAEAKNLMNMQTNDGNVIIMNAHISDASVGKIELPNSTNGFSGNKFAEFLFSISSELPSPLASAAETGGFSVQAGARGFVFNADGATLIKLLNFGSEGALR